MITIFNRCEVYFSLSAEKASKMRSRITSGNVECLMTRRSFERSDRRARGTVLSKTLIEYRLYVHKKDAEIAQFLMNQKEF